MENSRCQFNLFLRLCFCLLAIIAYADSHKARQDWLNHGGDLYNRRYADKETKISPETVSKLRLKWEFYAGKDITATPAIFNGTLYFPSWNGYIYAVKASDGSLVWKKNLQKLTGINSRQVIPNVNATVSRATPTIADDLLIFGIVSPAAIIAVNRSTGDLVWSTQLDNGIKEDIVVAVQKSGFAWALDRDNGNLVWSTEAGPGGGLGGGTWGAATDGKRVYTNIVNSDGKNFTLVPSMKTTTAGGWVAMDARTGKILWSTAVPGKPVNGSAGGPVTVSNGVLFGGTTNRQGPIYAIDAKIGKILWSYNTGASVYGGVSVSNGCIYLGNGYNVSLGSFFPSITSGTSLFAFCVL